ncbi:hypothetical protein BGHDH14_bghG005606000001001 [Blumeria hordei DH14]|uniref:DUF7905 domain-containing protein n=1 Tax=Blumeria graminis f. sp. hordei (strain DH14) TaxID=546991 RepID=N1JFE7_BLUG1|nr:hypothetical protein BGHDH14_bghG005606000001001 [Blumeria hordei DH14]
MIQEWDTDSIHALSDNGSDLIGDTGVTVIETSNVLVDISVPPLPASRAKVPAPTKALHTSILQDASPESRDVQALPESMAERSKKLNSRRSYNFGPAIRSDLAATRLQNLRKDRSAVKSTAGTGRKWGKPEGLISSRLATHRQASATERAETQQFLKLPEGQEFSARGCYLWPYWYESAIDLLGPRLEDLNPIRMNNHVWVEWDEVHNCINISSKSIKSADKAIVNAINGIRGLIDHARAVKVTANPLHIVYPPSSAVMRTLIKPKVVEKDPLRAADLELQGNYLSSRKKVAWKKNHLKEINKNIEIMREHLVRNILIYAPVKNWMRLRVHFGHITITNYTNEFAVKGLPWESFLKMVAAPRFSANIDRNLGNPLLALNLRNRICGPLSEYFCAVQGLTKLSDIPFKDSEIINFQCNNQLFRMEGEMDRSFDDPNQVYQVGSTALYRDNRRNVLVEVGTIDIERHLDWKLELIADNKDRVVDLPSDLRDLIKDSVPGKTELRRDVLGLDFPNVAPRSPSSSITITSVWVRSVVQYRKKDSGYIVEIAIYRKWETNKTTGDPMIFCSISMFHPDWDEETRDIFTTLGKRDWRDNLENFFKPGMQQPSGFHYFLNEIRTMQGFIYQLNNELSEQHEGP